MDAMALKKRKRDAEIKQETDMAICPASNPHNNHYIDAHCYQTSMRESPLSPLQNLSRINHCGRLSSPPANNFHRSCLRPMISPKKRRLDQKLAQLHSPSSTFPTPGHGQQQPWGGHEPVSPRTPEPYTTTLEGQSPKSAYGYLQQSQQQLRNNQVQKCANTNTNTNTLSPCHICHRRPTTRAVLDAYADCDLCSERTCYVCLRECNDVACRDPVLRQILNSNISGSSGGWNGVDRPLDAGREDARCINGHGGSNVETIGRRVCSLCAVEGITDTGAETVKCLVCVEGGG